MLPLWGVGHGGSDETFASGDLVQQGMVVQPIIGLPASPQLPQHNPKGVHINLKGTFSNVACLW